MENRHTREHFGQLPRLGFILSARVAGLGRFRRRSSLIWAMDPSLRDISYITHLGYGSKLHIYIWYNPIWALDLNLGSLNIWIYFRGWTDEQSAIGDIPPRFDVNRGTAEAQWGGVGEAGEQGQLLFFLGYIHFCWNLWLGKFFITSSICVVDHGRSMEILPYVYRISRNLVFWIGNSRMF